MAAGQRSRGLDRLAPTLVVYGLPGAALLGLGGAPPPVFLALLAALGVVALLGVVRSTSGRSVPVDAAALGLGAALLWTLTALVPLPAGVLSALAPLTTSFVQEGAAAGGLAWSWAPTSLAPGDTAVGAARLALPLAALLVLRLHGDGDRAVRVHRALAASAGLLVLVVAFHLLTRQTSIYGVFPVLGRNSSMLVSPFTNSNDMAALACALLPVVVVDALRYPRVVRAGAAGLAVALGAVALLSVSRSATLGLGVAVSVLVLGLLATRNTKQGGRVAVAAALAGGVLVFWVLRVTIWARQLVDPVALLKLDGRRVIWSGAWEMATGQWLTGVGSRAFGTVWWSVRDAVSRAEPRDGEGLIPHMLATLGIPMTVVLVFIGGALLVRAGRTALSRARGGDLVPLGAFAGLVALLAVGMFTLTTSQPAIALVVVYLHALTGDAPSRFSMRRRHVSGAVAGLVVLAAGLHAWGTPRSTDATDAWFAERIRSGEPATVDEVLDVALRHPADPYGYAWAGLLVGRQDPAAGLRLVHRAMAIDAHGAEPHRVAANVLLGAGLRDQALGEVRLALQGATPSELPRFVDEALRLYPTRDARLRLLPPHPDAAVRVVREFEARGVPGLAVDAWVRLARRSPPPFEAIRALQRWSPPLTSSEVLRLARQARASAPDEPRFAVLEGEAALRDGDAESARRLLQDALGALDDDLFRAQALLVLGDDALARGSSLEPLLALPTRGGDSEEAARAWLRGEQHLAAGRVSQAVRDFSTAARARPDLPRFARRLDAAREAAR